MHPSVCQTTVTTTDNKCVRVTTVWLFLRLRMEERPPIWRVAANILSRVKKVKQSRYRPGVAQRVPGS